jgi:SAM-dependent methyltransferase
VAAHLPRAGVGATLVDVAAGGGRHSRHALAMGYRVTAIDRDVSALTAAAAFEVLAADIEAAPWPYPGREWDAVLVCNYLHRPLLPVLVESVAPSGLFIYETFAQGNERFGKPSNPAYLLAPGELLEAVRGRLRVLAYEDVEVQTPKPAMVQRILARRGST